MTTTSNTTTLTFNAVVTEVLWDRNLTNEEKVGHIVSRCKFVRQTDLEVEDALKLVRLLEWATGVAVPRSLQIMWDKDNRVLKISFEKRDFFNGGREYFSRLGEAKNAKQGEIEYRRRHIAISGTRHPFWLVHVVDRVNKPEVTAQTGEEKEEAKETPVMEVQTVTPPPAPPKVVRNKRREKPQYTEVVLEDDDE